MTDLYENLLKATDNTNDITNEKYATITKIDGLLCSVKEDDTGLEHSNVPILNGADLELGDNVIIGFLNNSVYDVVCYGVLDRKVNSGSNVEIVAAWETILSDEKVPSEKLAKNTIDNKADINHTHGNISNDGKIGNASTATMLYFAGVGSSSNSLYKSDKLSSDVLIDSTAHSNIGSAANANQSSINGNVDTALSNKISKSQTAGLVRNDGSIDTTSYSTFSGSYNDLSNKPNIPTKTSQLTNDGADGTNVFIANNDSRLSDARTPTSHTHGNLSDDGKISNASTATMLYFAGVGSSSNSLFKSDKLTSDCLIDSSAHSNLGTSANASQTTINAAIDALIGAAITYINQ